jgi:hypothetical protein
VTPGVTVADPLVNRLALVDVGVVDLDYDFGCSNP